MTRKEKILLIKAGGVIDNKIEYPFFFNIDKQGRFVAGQYSLTESEFHALRQECYVSLTKEQLTALKQPPKHYVLCVDEKTTEQISLLQTI